MPPGPDPRLPAAPGIAPRIGELAENAETPENGENPENAETAENRENDENRENGEKLKTPKIAKTVRMLMPLGTGRDDICGMVARLGR